MADFEEENVIKAKVKTPAMHITLGLDVDKTYPRLRFLQKLEVNKKSKKMILLQSIKRKMIQRLMLSSNSNQGKNATHA